MLGTVEGYGGNITVWFVLLYELEFHMAVLGTDKTAVTVVIDVLGDEYR